MYSAKACKALEDKYRTPGAIAPNSDMLHSINADHPLKLVRTEMQTAGTLLFRRPGSHIPYVFLRPQHAVVYAYSTGHLTSIS